MAILRRKHRSAQHKGMPAVRAGLIAIALVAVGTYFGFTKANPFANPYKVEAVFDTVNNAAAGGNDALVTLDHRRDLLALVRVNDKYDFIMTHENSFWTD